MTREEKIEEAKRLRAEGLTYRAIGSRIGASYSTIRIWLDHPTAEQRCQRKRRRRSNDHKYRIHRALASSRYAAKRRGHTPCKATADEVLEAFTGRCHCCGVDEVDLRIRLAIDHDHESGDFRGFLCDKCNRGIGFLDNNPALAVEYLKRST